MNIDEVFYCFTNDSKRYDFLYKLETLGENSPEFQAIKNVLISLNMNQSPKGMHQSTNLKQIFQFCDARECFKNFRLVSKSWKFAVENNKYYKPNGSGILNDLTWKLKKHPKESIPLFYPKILQTLKHLEFSKEYIRDDAVIKNIFKLILENMKNLKSIVITCSKPKTGYKEFILSLLESSNTTVEKIEIMDVFFPDIAFDLVTTVQLHLFHTKLEDFQNHFPKMIDNMENLKEVQFVNGFGHKSKIPDFIAENYSEHFIEGSVWKLSQLPIKISTIYDTQQSTVEKWKYASTIQYLTINLRFGSFEEKFPNYEYIFESLFVNLKGVHFMDDSWRCKSFYESDEADEWDKQEWKTEWNLWNTFKSYLNSKGIETLTSTQIEDKGNELASQVAWFFKFIEKY